MLETHDTRTPSQRAAQRRAATFGGSRSKRAQHAPGSPAGAARSASRTRGTSLPAWEAPGRWERAEWLRRYSAAKSVKLCGLAGNGNGDVTVQRTNGKISFGGTLMCGSRLCPVCGPRIAADDKSEIERVLDWWLASGPKRRLLFGTFTLRHNRGQKYGELLDAAQKCWQAATGGRGWQADRHTHGIAWTIRVIEEKWSPKHGWHVHVHVLFLVDDDLAEAPAEETLLRAMYLRWARRAGTYGLGVPLLKAQDLHAVGKSQAAQRLARYFTKQSTDAPEEAEALAYELTGGARKEGRRSLTAGQIMAWAIRGEDYVAQLWGKARKGEKMRGVQGQEYALMLWKEYEAGRKNRRIIAWSHGLRDAAGAGPELDEQQKLERQEQIDALDKNRQTLVGCAPDQWKLLVAKRGQRAELAAFAVDASRAEIVRWFAERGVTARPYEEDRVGVRWSGPVIGDEAELYEKLPERMPF